MVVVDVESVVAVVVLVVVDALVSTEVEVEAEVSVVDEPPLSVEVVGAVVLVGLMHKLESLAQDPSVHFAHFLKGLEKAAPGKRAALAPTAASILRRVSVSTIFPTPA